MLLHFCETWSLLRKDLNVSLMKPICWSPCAVNGLGNFDFQIPWVPGTHLPHYLVIMPEAIKTKVLLQTYQDQKSNL